jgi:histidinol-phosphate aminotransferase
MSIESLARPEIVAMKPYSSARKEAPGKGILLNANEAPWPLLDDSEGETGLNRYPDPQPAELISRLADLYSTDRESILVTRGSDEGIDLLTRVFCHAGKDAILQCPPTFGMYRIAAQTQGAGIVSVPRNPDGFGLDEPAVLEALNKNRQVKLVFLTSPNNPTGDVINDDFLQILLRSLQNRALVVVDEAYSEFCRQPSTTALIGDHENLVVLRTMSKAWAAAGLRCGAVLAQAPVISLLQRVIAPYPLPSPVVGLAMRMLSTEVLEKQKLMLRQLETNKKFLMDSLENRSFIQDILPGEANFILVRVEAPDGLLDFLAQRNVILRGFPGEPMLDGWIRISTGSEDEIRALSAALNEWEANR